VEIEEVDKSWEVELRGKKRKKKTKTKYRLGGRVKHKKNWREK
jgi:hypothetical protein